jgi:hypothetical protein
MVLGSVFILGGVIYIINPNAFRRWNDKWTSTTRNSMLPGQYAKRIRTYAVIGILGGIYFILRDLKIF